MSCILTAPNFCRYHQLDQLAWLLCMWLCRNLEPIEIMGKKYYWRISVWSFSDCEIVMLNGISYWITVTEILTLKPFDRAFFEKERTHILTLRKSLFSTTSDGENKSIPVNPRIWQICHKMIYYIRIPKTYETASKFNSSQLLQKKMANWKRSMIVFQTLAWMLPIWTDGVSVGENTYVRDWRMTKYDM